MAPWPQVGNEPKAPDKNDSRDSVDTSPRDNTDDTSDSLVATRLQSEQASKQSEEKEVLTLDEGQLKALLDEAITYKNPKDREGKSELFKELLQEAEADESDSKELGGSLTGKLPRGYYNLPSRKRHTRHQGRECGVGVSTTRGGSLQNLHALGMEGGGSGSGNRSGRSRRNGRSGETLVSARQREGGSLPSNVNVDNDPDLDSMICPNYTSRATLEVSGLRSDETHSEKSSSIVSYSLLNGTEMVPLQLPSDPCLTYNSTSTKDIDSDEIYIASSLCVGPIESGAMLYPPVPSPVQHVSVLSIPPSQIHTGPDEVSSDMKPPTATTVAVPAAVEPTAADTDRTVATDGMLSLPIAQWRRFSSYTFLDFRDPATRMATFGKESTEAKTKPVDENGNALGCTRVDSNCQDRKKQRRLKTKNEKNIRDFKSDEIEGFRGGADIETLMEYIESRPPNTSVVDGPKASKSRPNQSQNQTNGIRSTIRVRAKEEDSRPIKRRTKEKFQRCNSLEEISKTKLEDLTEESSSEKVNGNGSSLALQVPVKQVTLDDAELGKKSSWANRQADSHTNSGDKLVKISETKSVVRRQKDQKLEKTSQEGIQDAEFHVVTKKQRKKKRRAGCSGRVGAKPVFPAHDRTLERSCGGASAAGLLYQCRGKGSGAAPRRKSASSVPPSDKSDSSDLDSVHSLPVSSTTSRTRVGKNSVSGGSTPAASYADIARSAASPPRGAISPPPPPGTTKRDAMTDMSCDKPALLNEEYPPLEVKTTDYFIDSLKTTSQASRDGSEKSSSKTVPVNTNVIVCSESGPCAIETDCSKATGAVVVTVKRPPVILMDELEPIAGSQVPTEITFGFEVNQQLLQSDDSVVSFEPSASVTSNVVSNPISSPPIVVTDPSLKRLIQYHNSAWEEVMKDLRLNKAMYHDGQ